MPTAHSFTSANIVLIGVTLACGVSLAGQDHVPWAVSATAQPPPAAAAQEELRALSADALLARAGEYVSRFERAMGVSVLDERYVQIIKVWTFPPKDPDAQRLAWRDDESAPTRDLQMSERRQTKAELLLVQLPNQEWTAFRDTLEVNGRVLPGHANRLRKLFLEGTDDARRQLRQIREASADWNLGRVYRNINVPTSGLMAVHTLYQRRFVFRVGELTSQCRLISFKETSKPTLTRSIRGEDVPLVGDVCVDKAGAVWSTRITFDGRHSGRGAVRVTYRPEGRVTVLIPDTMWEWYVLPNQNKDGLPLYIEAMAIYSTLRQFMVTTSEAVR